MNDRFAVCEGRLLLDCLRLIDEVVLRPREHAAAMALSPEGFYLSRLRALGAEVLRFPRVMFTVGAVGEAGWGEGGVGPSHKPQRRPDPAFGVHVKYPAEYYAALKTCFRDRPLEALGV